MYSNLPERRKSIRREFSIPLQYKGFEPSVNKAMTKDVGESGVKFTTNNFIPVFTKLVVNIFFNPGEPVKILSEVVWVRKLPHLDLYSIGTRFTELKEEQKRLIADYLDVDIASV